jgi:hypothetical protein
MNGEFSRCIRQAAIAIVASGAVAAAPLYAKSSNNLIVVPPTDLPELARQAGDAMLLHDTIDGRTLLYIEQNLGTRLAILDVTDPGHVKGEGSVPLDATGPFDFVSTLGSGAEVIRFRQGQGNAVLDLHKVKVPTLKRVQGLTLQGPVSPLGDDGFTVSGQAVTLHQATDPRLTRDYQVVDTSNSRDPSRVFDVKDVREELTKQDTGTSFLLTDGGLYLIRRPVIESDKRRREEEWSLEHSNGGG